MVINKGVANDDSSFGGRVFGVPRTAEARPVSVAAPKLGTPPVVTPPAPSDPRLPLVGALFMQPKAQVTANKAQRS
jgi:hypothetical protein